MSTSDIVERLRGFAASWHRCKSGPAGWLKFPEHYEEAAAEIERLRCELSAYQKAKAENDERYMIERDVALREVTRLRAENERLRAMVPITNVHDMSHVHEVDLLEQGLRDIDMGRVHDHEDVKRELLGGDAP